ncbi:MAG TPA: hypothetical protein VN915_06305 [Elusimicrobiota bacterium]|nr:hypothetical protein [Elusimicrobiota bacterium]
MNDMTPTMTSKIFAWLPLASLAISAAMFSLGAPAALARCIRPSVSLNFAAQLENAVREEPVLFPMPMPVARLPLLSAPLVARR